MKLYTYAIFGIFLMSATEAWTMDRPVNASIAHEVALHGEVASLDEAYKALSENTSSLVARLDNETDAALLQDWLNNLVAGRKDLISALNKTLGSIQKAHLADKEAQMLMYPCFNILKSVNTIDFALIESKIARLKGKSGNRGKSGDLESKEALRHEKRRRETEPATFLSLPASIESKAVFHPEVLQVPGFCCGYNALFNACNFEDWCGIENCCSDYTLFKDTCMGYLGHRNIHPKFKVYTNTLEDLAMHLGLNHLYNLGYDYNKTIQQLLLLPSLAALTAGNHVEIQRMYEAVAARKSPELFSSIKKRLDQNKKRYEIVHFVCCLETEGVLHAILMALVQNETGRGLYVFDNTNERINEGSPAKRYIDFLCTTFSVSRRDQFRGKELPYCWPTVPRA